MAPNHLMWTWHQCFYFLVIIFWSKLSREVQWHCWKRTSTVVPLGASFSISTSLPPAGQCCGPQAQTRTCWTLVFCSESRKQQAASKTEHVNGSNQKCVRNISTAWKQNQKTFCKPHVVLGGRVFGGKEPQKIKMRMKYDTGSLVHVNQHVETLFYEMLLLGKFYHLLKHIFQVETGCMSFGFATKLCRHRRRESTH